MMAPIIPDWNSAIYIRWIDKYLEDAFIPQLDKELGNGANTKIWMSVNPESKRDYGYWITLATEFSGDAPTEEDYNDAIHKIVDEQDSYLFAITPQDRMRTMFNDGFMSTGFSATLPPEFLMKYVHIDDVNKG